LIAGIGGAGSVEASFFASAPKPNGAKPIRIVTLLRFRKRFMPKQ
jgi:hypothetical protein